MSDNGNLFPKQMASAPTAQFSIARDEFKWSKVSRALGKEWGGIVISSAEKFSASARVCMGA